MRRVSILLLLIYLTAGWTLPANAENRKIGENQSEAKRAAKQQRKISGKAAKRQRKAMKQTQKAQRRAARNHSHA